MADRNADVGNGNDRSGNGAKSGAELSGQDSSTIPVRHLGHWGKGTIFGNYRRFDGLWLGAKKTKESFA